ncbi:MAG: hypothetical protein ABH857_04975 [Elusimicrobiota bacterium]
MNITITKKIFNILAGIIFITAFVFGQDQWDDSFFENSEMGAAGPLQIWQPTLFDVWLSWATFNFTIYYQSEESVGEIISNIETAYGNIVEDLGYIFYYNPKRIKIFVYNTPQEYHFKQNISSWAGGHSNFKNYAIYTYSQKNIMENVVVHELTHLIFDSHMGYPRMLNVDWLHEGLAVYEEKKYSKQKWDILKLKQMIKNGQYIPVRKAIKTNTGYESDTKNVALWYLEMGTLVQYLLTLGQDGFKVFCDKFKIYKNVDEALKMTYPWDFHSIDDLDAKWKAWLLKQENKM